MYYVYALHPRDGHTSPTLFGDKRVRGLQQIAAQSGPFPTMAAALAYVDKMRPKYDCEVWLDLLEIATFRRMPAQA